MEHKNEQTTRQVFATDHWIRPFMTKYKRLLALVLVLGLITFFCGSALMFNSGYLISRAASKPENILLIYVPIVLTRAFGIGRPVFRYVERLTSHNWVLKMTSDLRVKLYRTLEKDAIFFKQHYKTGDILGVLAEDINHLQNMYLRTIFPTIIAWLLYLLVIIGLGWFSLPFGLVMLLLLAVEVILLPLWSVLVNGARHAKRKAQKNQLYEQLTDGVLGISDWLFSGRAQDFVHGYESAEKELRTGEVKLNQFKRRRDFLVQLGFGLITLVLLVWTSLTFKGHYGGDANWIAAFVLSVFPLIDAFAPLSDAASEVPIYEDSIKRLNKLPDENQLTESEKKQQTFSLTATPSQFEKIELKAVSFRYRADEPEILRHLSLEIQRGEKIAILGKSGAGKSTLGQLLRGDLSPTSGQLLLNGEPTALFGDQMPYWIGVINQSPYLFNTTILNNLRLGRTDASEEEVWRVLEEVGLTEMVQKLPAGLATMVDEAGMRFSGGERQRLALARILLQNVPIVLLDEPTVGLDPITEQDLLNTLFKTIADRTLIWITHHLQGVKAVDRVIFIEEGQIEMQGTPAELMANNERYRNLYRLDRGE